MPDPTSQLDPYQMQQILDYLRGAPKQGMPDQGPFMKDRLNNMKQKYQGLAPDQPTPFPYSSYGTLPPELPSGNRTWVPPFTSPYSGKTFPGNMYQGNPYAPSKDQDI